MHSSVKMTPSTATSSALQDKLAELKETQEREKVELSSEVERYYQKHVEAIQEKLAKGEAILESDLEFIDEVKMWMSTPEELRAKFTSIKTMKDSDEMKSWMNMPEIWRENFESMEAIAKKWPNLMHLLNASAEEKEWIYENFRPEKDRLVAQNLYLGGFERLTTLPDRLEVKGYLDLKLCTSLTSLPESLKVKDLGLEHCYKLTSLPEGLRINNLNLDGCTGLTSLPEKLEVNELYLSNDLNEQVKVDAERLKKEGKIKYIEYV